MLLAQVADGMYIRYVKYNGFPSACSSRRPACLPASSSIAIAHRTVLLPLLTPRDLSTLVWDLAKLPTEVTQKLEESHPLSLYRIALLPILQGIGSAFQAETPKNGNSKRRCQLR